MGQDRSKLKELEKWFQYYNNMFKKTKREFYEKKVDEYEDKIAVEELKLQPHHYHKFCEEDLTMMPAGDIVKRDLSDGTVRKSITIHRSEEGMLLTKESMEKVMKTMEDNLKNHSKSHETMLSELKSISPLAWDELEKEMLKQKDKDGNSKRGT